MALRGYRHPASGYVQGINDLVTPFLAVFLSPHMDGAVGDETTTEFPEEVRCSLHSHSLLSMVHCCTAYLTLDVYMARKLLPGLPTSVSAYASPRYDAHCVY